LKESNLKSGFLLQITSFYCLENDIANELGHLEENSFLCLLKTEYKISR